MSIKTRIAIWTALSCFLFWRSELWFLVMFLGGTSNLVAVYLNGGKMPSLGDCSHPNKHKPLTEDSRLKPLCDVHESRFGHYSVGDVLLMVGWLLNTVGILVRAR